MADALLTIEDLRVTTATGDGLELGPVDLTVARREVVGVVGDSGAGKSLLVAALTGTLRAAGRITSGRVLFEGTDLADPALADRTRPLRGRRVAFIGSNPHSLLHPLLPVGRQVETVLRTHTGVRRAEARERVRAMFESVGIPDPARRLDAYPHELSGGMAQRVVVAMGLICDPDVIVADEPTAGLDVTIQAQVLELVERMVRERGERGMLLATRDLGVVARFCDRVVVLDAGRVAEQGPVRDLFARPQAAGARLISASRGF